MRVRWLVVAVGLAGGCSIPFELVPLPDGGAVDAGGTGGGEAAGGGSALGGGHSNGGASEGGGSEKKDAGMGGGRVDAGAGGGMGGGPTDGGFKDAGPGGGTDGGLTDGGADASDGGCATIDETTCTSNAACRATFCFNCQCMPAFFACSPMGGALPVCPQFTCADSCCRQTTDCNDGSGGICIAPGETQCAVMIPVTDPCVLDGLCAMHEICDLALCTANGLLSCIPDCTVTGCSAGQTCPGGANARCQPDSCSVDGDCPNSFRCSLGGCQRQLCPDGDSDCSTDGTSYCVNGSCYPSLGICELPVP